MSDALSRLRKSACPEVSRFLLHTKLRIERVRLVTLSYPFASAYESSVLY
jgi:hypothetical protein